MIAFAAVISGVLNIGMIPVITGESPLPNFLPGHDTMVVRIVLVVAYASLMPWLACVLFAEIADNMLKKWGTVSVSRGSDYYPVSYYYPVSAILHTGRSLPLIISGGIVGGVTGVILGASLKIIEVPLYALIAAAVGPYLLGYFAVALVRTRYGR